MSKETERLTAGEIEFLLEALRYAEMNFEKTEYPTYEMRREKMNYVDALRQKLRRLRDTDQ